MRVDFVTFFEEVLAKKFAKLIRKSENQGCSCFLPNRRSVGSLFQWSSQEKNCQFTIRVQYSKLPFEEKYCIFPFHSLMEKLLNSVLAFFIGYYCITNEFIYMADKS